MKIVDATWEKRNLGVDVIEVSCAENDSAEELADTLKGINTPYSVVKIPSGCISLLFKAQQEGYRVIELSFEIQGDIRRIHTPEIYERFIKHITMEKAEGLILERVLDEIKRGEIFKTDRIAIDPFFSTEIAGQRYYNWSRDILEDGGFMGVLYYKEQPVAFNLSILSKDGNGISDGILGGLLPEAPNLGLGFLVVHAENEICRILHGKHCLGRVSSNNLPILRLHTQFGYEIKNATYILVKHR